MGGDSCTVKYCGYKNKNDVNHFLITVPKHAYYDPKWMEVIGKNKPLRWRPKKSTKICSKHFIKNSFS